MRFLPLILLRRSSLPLQVFQTRLFGSRSQQLGDGKTQNYHIPLGNIRPKRILNFKHIMFIKVLREV